MRVCCKSIPEFENKFLQLFLVDNGFFFFKLQKKLFKRSHFDFLKSVGSDKYGWSCLNPWVWELNLGPLTEVSAC